LDQKLFEQLAAWLTRGAIVSRSSSKAMLSLEPGDAPSVRDLLLEHFRNPALEVEGKLGRRAKDKFNAGVSAEQFAALEARLRKGSPCLGLPPGSHLQEPEVTIDRFFALEVADAGTKCSGRARGCERAPTVRSSFACDDSGCPLDEPIEVLNKTRLSDCHIGRPSGDAAPPPDCLVDLRVSFSLETVVPQDIAAGAALIYERRKRRRTFEAKLWRIQLTHVTVGQREAFEVEVELRMEIVRPRLEAAASQADEALRITRELVAALRKLAGWAAEIPLARKRKRTEDFQAVDLALRAALEEPEVDAELRRCICEGKEAPHRAKHYLCGILRVRLSSVDEAALHRFAGRQVARVLQRQRSGTVGEANKLKGEGMIPAQ